MTWEKDLHVPAGHTMSFADALGHLSEDLLLKVIFPKWVYPLSKRLQRLDRSYNELHVCVLLRSSKIYLTRLAIHERNGSRAAEFS